MCTSLRRLRSAAFGAFLLASSASIGCEESSPPPDILGSSYELVATVDTVEPPSPGGPTAYADRVPTTLPLTLRLDDTSGADGTALLGGEGAAIAFPYTRRWETRDGSPGLVVEAEASSCGSPSQVTIGTLHLSSVDLATGAVTGAFTGTARVSLGDAYVDYAISGTVSGGVDASAPTLSAAGAVDSPFRTLSFDASEPLAAGTTLSLTGPASFVLSFVPRAAAESVVGFDGASALLPFDSTLTLAASPTLADLAGNAATTLPTITTPAAPGLFAADGFEGSVTASLSTGVQVRTLTGTAYAITGDRALELSSGRALFELSVPAGATKLVFAYRGVVSSPVTLPGDALVVRTGSGTTLLASKTVPIPFGSYQAAGDGTGSSVSQALTYELPLSLAGVTTLVVELERASVCGSPLRSVVVDDLRVQ